MSLIYLPTPIEDVTAERRDRFAELRQDLGLTEQDSLGEALWALMVRVKAIEAEIERLTAELRVACRLEP